MAPNTLNLNALADAIAKGIRDGTTGVVSGFMQDSDRRHVLANIVQENVEKVYQLDGEVKLLKGMMTSLIGTGDGSTGMVPRLEKDMSSLKSEVQELRQDVSSVKVDVQAIRAAQSAQSAWTDGWRGIGVFLSIMATVISVVGGIVLGVIWLYRH